MRRYLVVANQTLGGYHLVVKVRECLGLGECSFHVVVPATHPRDQLTWTEGQARAIAHQRLEEALARLRDLGAEAEGEVGDENPVLAIDDALRQGDFDEVILSTLPPGLSRWLRMDLPRRVQRSVGLPVSHVVEASDRVAGSPPA